MRLFCFMLEPEIPCTSLRTSGSHFERKESVLRSFVFCKLRVFSRPSKLDLGCPLFICFLRFLRLANITVAESETLSAWSRTRFQTLLQSVDR
jgi:hypothetical protein